MKVIKAMSSAAAVLILASEACAVEGLTISVRSSNVVLGWPSAPNETYIVQYRPSLDPSAPWVTLTNSLPADGSTNWTTFVHSNVVPAAFISTNGGGGGGGSPPPVQSALQSSSRTNLSASATSQATAPLDPATLAFLAENSVFPPYVWDLQRRAPHRWELECRPPFPWDPDAPFAPEAPDGAGAILPTGRGHRDGPHQDGGGGATDPGFYQVARVGIHLFGVTNGTFLSGQVSLPLEFGNIDDGGTLQWLFLPDTNPDNTLQGVSFPDLSAGVPNHLTGVWDTTQTPNGAYTIQMTATLDDGTYYTDTPVSVTVSNLAWFVDPWPVGGLAIFFGVQTVYTDGNGAWSVDIYDDQNAFVGSARGPIDSQGYLAWPGTSGPFSFDNTDGNGNLNPSAYYTMAITTDAAHPLAARDKPLTNVVVIENWPLADLYSGTTRATAVCQDVFGDGHPIGQTEFMQLAAQVCEVEGSYHQMELGSAPNPFQIPQQGTFIYPVMRPSMTDPACRDFIWNGHGGPAIIGSGTLATCITKGMVASLLTNTASNPLTGTKGTNGHPYRFVLLNGCSTANGNWPLEFAIPKQQHMKVTDFTQKRGVRPRAFLGWNQDKQSGWLRTGDMEQNFQWWNDSFWTSWNTWDTAKGDWKYKLSDAVHRKFNNPDGTQNTGAAGAIIYGADDLPIAP